MPRKPRKAPDRRNMYSDRKRQVARKLRQSNVADGGIQPRVMEVINHYFANGFHQREAMIAAGYAESTARLDQWRVFGRPDVKAEIERRMKLLTDKSEIDGDWLMRKLKLLIEGNPGAIVAKLEAHGNDINCLSDEEWFVLGGVEITRTEILSGHKKDGTPVFGIETKVKVKPEGKNQMIVTALKKLGLFKDSVEVTLQEDLTAALMAGRQRAAKGEK